MADDEPQISILDARLAEIDRRLRTIQTGLADDAGAEPGPATGLPPKIAVPEPSGGTRPPVAPAPPAPAPAPASTPAPAPAPAPADGTGEANVPGEDSTLVIAALRGLISDHARLLDAMGELLTSGERLLARAQAAPAPQELRPPPPVIPTAAPSTAAPSAPAPPAPPAQVSVTAGPFPSLEAVRDFERAIGTLPNVASVDVRGYEGEDRAMLDVHLSRPNP